MYHWDLFIAYASPDRAVAKELYQALQKQGGVIPALSKVCVQVHVATEHPLHRGEGFPSVKRLPDVLSVKTHRLWALLGEPGSGKSTLLHNLVLQVLDDPDSTWFPVLLKEAIQQLRSRKSFETMARNPLLLTRHPHHPSPPATHPPPGSPWAPAPIWW